MLKEGSLVNDRYQILRVIGKGGMSTVYQAKDINSGALLAIKDVMRSEKNPTQVVEQSLAAEGRMLMALQNPHLPQIYDIIEQPENFMLVMDYIDGDSLDHVIAQQGPQPMERVLNWGMQICDVFDYLHNQPTPIIYRDMKPANVMLKPDGQLMMIDFGTARTEKVGQEMQADTICIGTAGFAAPEQFGGFGQSTARTDIFCLGATLYNMITGHSPCDRPQGILPLETWNPALAGTPLSEIITRCTRNDPDERYQTAKELRQDLYLASIGKYRSVGKSGHLTGGLKMLSWQRQELKGAGGKSTGLSGLLGGLTSSFSKAGTAPETEAPAVRTTGAGWQPAQQMVPPETKTAVPPAAIPEPISQPGAPAVSEETVSNNGTWHLLTLIGMVIAIVFTLFCVLLLCLQQITAGLVFVIIALGGAALAAIGVIFNRNAQTSENERV